MHLRNRSGEVDGRQFRMCGDGFAKDWSVGWNEVNDAIGETGVTEDLVNQMVGQDCSVAGFPDNAVALNANMCVIKIAHVFFNKHFLCRAADCKRETMFLMTLMNKMWE